MCGFQKGFIKTECQGGCNEVPHLFKAVMTMEQRKLLIRNGVEKINSLGSRTPSRVFLPFVQYLAGYRDSNPRCCDCNQVCNQ